MSCSSSDAAPERWTVDSHDAKLTIPYLGPEPRPSRIWGIAFLGSCAVAVMVFLVRAALYLRQSALEADLLAHPGAAPRAEYLEVMDRLSDLAFKAYRNLVYETPGFEQYFWESTVISEIAT